MIPPRHYLEAVVRPTLRHLAGAAYLPGLHTPAAEVLMVGTAIIESGLTWLWQHNGGPARGFEQFEDPTVQDVGRYLARPENRPLRSAVLALVPGRWSRTRRDGALVFPFPTADDLVGNLPASVAVARVWYWYDPRPLPAADDLPGMAAYWKRRYNTAAGAGKADKFVAQFLKHAGDPADLVGAA